MDMFKEYMRSAEKENKKTKHIETTFDTLVGSLECGFRAMNAKFTKQRASLLLDTYLGKFIYTYCGVICANSTCKPMAPKWSTQHNR